MITDLRFIERDGERILQVLEECDKVDGTKIPVWLDVRVEPEERFVMITRKEFWEAVNKIYPWETETFPLPAWVMAVARKLGLED